MPKAESDLAMLRPGRAVTRERNIVFFILLPPGHHIPGLLLLFRERAHGAAQTLRYAFRREASLFVAVPHEASRHSRHRPGLPISRSGSFQTLLLLRGSPRVHTNERKPIMNA